MTVRKTEKTGQEKRTEDITGKKKATTGTLKSIITGVPMMIKKLMKRIPGRKT